MIKGPVSLEVVSTDFAGMMKEANVLSKISKNVIVDYVNFKKKIMIQRKLHNYLTSFDQLTLNLNLFLYTIFLFVLKFHPHNK